MVNINMIIYNKSNSETYIISLKTNTNGQPFQDLVSQVHQLLKFAKYNVWKKYNIVS